MATLRTRSIRWAWVWFVAGMCGAPSCPFVDEGPVNVFEEVSQEAGVTFFYTVPGEDLDGSGGGGVAVADVDLDGDLDIFFPQGDGANALYLQKAPWRFVDAAPRLGLTFPDERSHGALFFDMDNDGDPDLYITSDGPNHLLRNERVERGELAFTDLTGSSGTTHCFEEGCGFSTGAVAVDVDRDGWLDLYVNDFWHDDADRLGIENALYHNEGDGTFTDIAPLLGIDDAGCTWASVFFDADDDGDLDLFVGNDGGLCFTPDTFYVNAGTDEGGMPIFRDETAALGLLEPRRSTMGATVGDYDGDGDLDLYLSDMFHNWLYRNDGAGFVEVTAQAGVGCRAPSEMDLPRVNWGVRFFDYDSDGLLDLLSVAGTIFGEFDQASQQDCLFRNLGDGTFEQIMDAGVDEAVTQGRGVATGDFDRDGDLDYTVSGGYDDWATLYRFEAGDHHWLDIDLVGRGSEGSNRDGIGALVTVEAGGHRQVRLVTPAGAPGSGQDLTLHFGLGEETSVDRISVRWPSGRVTELTAQTRVDRRIEIEEPPTGR